MEERIGFLIFILNFDLGNLVCVERVKLEENNLSQEDDGIIVIILDYDYNVWIVFDCVGMECENLNRIWFYFGVKGG